MKFIGGCLCLDFINTVAGWTADSRPLDDKIASYGYWIRWAQLVGAMEPAEAEGLLARARRHRSEARRIWSRAKSLRTALHRIFRAAIANRKPADADLRVLRRELKTAWNHQELVHAKGRFDCAWDNSRKALDSVLWRVSRSAAELLTSSEVKRLRECGGHECGWMFLDRSRNHSRQWCDMQECGNRAKVRRFRERHATAG